MAPAQRISTNPTALRVVDAADRVVEPLNSRKFPIMLKLDLTAEPRWLDLGHGVRLRVAPLTTALMVAARSDAAVEALPATASDEERALVFAKAIARHRRDRLGGRRRRRRQPGPGHARGHRRAARGLADLRGVPGDLRLEGPAAGRGKKRLRALADWHFGGGDRYCAACAQACPDCPARLNRPETCEGWQVWDLALRLGGQLRVIPGAVIGWDLGAALALAAALGIAPLAAAELLPEIEAVMVRKLNETIGDSHD